MKLVKVNQNFEILIKSTSTFGITFFLKKYKSKNGKAPVYARISVDGIRLDISMKTEIANWNKAKGMAKGKSEEIRKINTQLEQVRAKLVDSYQQLVIQNKLITADAIKNLFLGEEEKGKTLNNLIEYHNT